MNCFFKWLNINFFCCFFINSCFAGQSLENRMMLAAEILKQYKSGQIDLTKVAEQFADENYNTCGWYLDHAVSVGKSLLNESEAIFDVCQVNIGSRTIGTSHLLSGLDIAFITKHNEKIDNVGVQNLLSDYYKKNYPLVQQVFSVTTGEELYWPIKGLLVLTMENFTDSQLGQIKLQYVIQDCKTVELIQEHNQKVSSRFPSNDARICYAYEMMKSVYANNVAKASK